MEDDEEQEEQEEEGEETEMEKEDNDGGGWRHHLDFAPRCFAGLQWNVQRLLPAPPPLLPPPLALLLTLLLPPPGPTPPRVARLSHGKTTQSMVITHVSVSAA